MNNNPIIVPNQKDITKENNPDDNPKSQPKPKINLPSPSPINRPLEKYQRDAKGIARTGPAIRSVQEGKMKIELRLVNEIFIKIERKEIKIKR